MRIQTMNHDRSLRARTTPSLTQRTADVSTDTFQSGDPTKTESVTNFGGNQKWKAQVYSPKTEAEVLRILEDHKDQQIRPVGSLHSWSDITKSKDLTLVMSNFKTIETFERDGKKLARIGSGAHLHEILKELHAKTDQTLPTLGAITQQTISGAKKWRIANFPFWRRPRPRLSSFITPWPWMCFITPPSRAP